MKKLPILSIFLLLFALYSCDLGNITTDLKTKFEAVFDIDIPANTVTSVAMTKDVDAESNKDYKDNKDKIKDLQVVTISYVISESTVSDNSNKFTGSIVYSHFDGSNAITLASLTDASLQNGTYSITATEENLNKIAANIRSSGKFKVSLNGAVTSVPVKLKLKVIYDTKLKVSAQ